MLMIVAESLVEYNHRYGDRKTASYHPKKGCRFR